MKMALALLIFAGPIAQAAGVPRCWKADLPGQQIEDGSFRVFVPTAEHSATQVAEVFAILLNSMASQTGVGTRDALDRIEIDLYGDLQYWRPTAAFPTLASFKDYIVRSIEPVLTVPGVTVECAKVNRHVPSEDRHFSLVPTSTVQ